MQCVRGWLASRQKEIYQRCLVSHQYISTCVNMPAQQFLLKLLQDWSLEQEILNEFIREYKGKQDYFFDNVKGGFRKPNVGFFGFLPVPKGFSDAGEFSEKLLQDHNLLVIPGNAFGSKGEHFYRVNFGIDQDRLTKAVKILNSYY